MIQYVDRKTGAVCTEKVYGHKPLSLLYGDGFLSLLLYYTILPLLAHLPFFSRLYGYLQKRPASRKKIAPFIRAYGVDESEFERTEFKSFNDFFIRTLKPVCRPIDSRSEVLTMPADGRYLAFDRFDRFFVKGQEFSLESFLQNGGSCKTIRTRKTDDFGAHCQSQLADSCRSDECPPSRVGEEERRRGVPKGQFCGGGEFCNCLNGSYAHRFSNGSMLIARLCPVDYHRFHFPCDGLAKAPRLINGSLYSVNPIALKKRIQILSENKRVITEIETDRFGTLLYIEIGATAVGTIRQTFASNSQVRKGQEKGYFEFGGSCLVLLFEEGRVCFDADLVDNTKRGFETLVHFGESMGRSKMGHSDSSQIPSS